MLTERILDLIAPRVIGRVDPVEADTVQNAKGGALLLGGFDGLHKGHGTLLAAAKGTGLPVTAMCIEGGKGAPLFTAEEREEIFKSNGVRREVSFRFEEIKGVSAEEFALAIKEKLHPNICFCGEDFRFGAGGKSCGGDFYRYTGIPVRAIPVLKDDNGEKIGTERIKGLLAAGKIAEANALSGEEFFLKGEVIRDRGVGRTLGFPTANIPYPAGKFKIKRGVYKTRAEIDGKIYTGVTNYGSRPTFANDTVMTETYFLGFSGDLYGRRLNVRFVEYLREIRAFESADALKEQLREDKRRAEESD